ncbi:MAG: purine-binding chemotaxis protein CheW [Burkholderiales bacterium]|nr:purine-binding chemotaxis protein CheW [Burkholderiales bacterium]
MNASPHAISSISSQAVADMPPMLLPPACLIFSLGTKKFGLDAGKVRELLQYDALTKLADGAQVIEDVVVWRGNVVPVVDMRIRFNFGMPSYDARTCILILEVGGRYIGMAVDSVAKVVKLTQQDIKPLPAGVAAAASCLLGLGMDEEDNFILIDIDKLMQITDVHANQKLS